MVATGAIFETPGVRVRGAHNQVEPGPVAFELDPASGNNNCDFVQYLAWPGNSERETLPVEPLDDPSDQGAFRPYCLRS